MEIWEWEIIIFCHKCLVAFYPNNEDNQENIIITGGPVGEDKYAFSQIHFHWGTDENSKGSEHYINGVSFPMEAHMVHINEKYKNLNESLEKDDGLLVLGLLFKVQKGAKPVDALVVIM